MITSVFLFRENIFYVMCFFETCVSVCMNFSSSSYICLIIYFYSKKFFFEDIKNKLCCFHLDDFLFKKFLIKKFTFYLFSHFLCVFSCFFGGQRKKILHSWLKLQKRVDIPQRVTFTFVLFLFSRFRGRVSEREKSDRAKKIEIFSPNLDVNTPKPPPNASALEHCQFLLVAVLLPIVYLPLSPSTTLQTPLRSLFKASFSPLPPCLNSRGFGVFIDNVERVRFGVLGYAPAEL